MTIIGFDVSKDELVGVRITKRAIPLETFTIPNTRDEIAMFLASTLGSHPRLAVASEATAEYHRILAEECIARAIPFRLLNPILTKQFTRGTIRKQKTDRTDALIIAKLALQGEGTVLTQRSLHPLKSISRVAHKLARLERILRAMTLRLERVFPDEAETYRALECSRKALEGAVKNVRSHICSKVEPEVETLLMSIPGVGPTLAVTLMTEIGDIGRFPSGKALIAYAGLDPRVRQSGTSLKRNTRLTKRGSPYLRRAAYIAAYVAKRCEPELALYHAKKMAEGKRYKEATVATARKMLYRVYAVWKRGTPYVRGSVPPELSTVAP